MPYAASSRGGPQVNADGSRNVYCYSCTQFIGRSYLKVGRALCELCRRTESGEPLTEDAIRQYMMSKAEKVDVSALVLPELPPKVLGRKFSLRSMGGDILRAIGLKIPAKEPVPSVKIARGKKRPRLFANVDLGSMETLDKELKKPPL